MEKLHSVQINIDGCVKEISVYCGDVTAFDESIDILTTSAFVRSYAPTPRTVFSALYNKGVDVYKLASDPEFDLRDSCHVWISKEILSEMVRIRRIGCIELIGYHNCTLDFSETEQSMINSFKAYFKMLELASIYGIEIGTVALPMLGSGSQGLSSKLLVIPLLNECISFLKRNPDARRIMFIEKNPEKAELICNFLRSSFRFLNGVEVSGRGESSRDKRVFISYATNDKNIADNLCFKLESKGIKVWYAPRDVVGPYAESIYNAIERVSYFVVILSQNSIDSEHVLNEVDLAFQRLPNNIRFKPLRIDNAIFTPSFKYYLSRQYWMDATIPPLEERLNEFVESLLHDCR